MTSSYGNLFQIPPYFAYILRSFTVLEGIGLASDPNYAIVQECYPTLAQRLFVVPALLPSPPLPSLVSETSVEPIVHESIPLLIRNKLHLVAASYCPRTKGKSRSFEIVREC
jgi:predicted unusual protein kinase regulating ubiquinone biosynthesis (AarF/ABC1/UbiB family)